MSFTPRYEGPPPLSVEMAVADPSVLLVRQRRRLADILGALETEQWAVASRCAGWSVQDVIAHLIGTNRFWAHSIRSGLAGTPTRLLIGFDPVATPAMMVDSMRSLTPGAVLEDFVASVDDLADALDGAEARLWSQPAEAPPGHIAVGAVALHALWDSWVHERDIVLPLGLSPLEEADEVTASLVYVAILGPSVWAAGGRPRSGQLAIHADHPTVRFVVDVGETVVARPAVAGDADCPRLTGPAVPLIEGLSCRTPLHHDLTVDDRWLVEGLALAFNPTSS